MCVCVNVLVFVGEALFLVDTLREEERNDRDGFTSSESVVGQNCQVLSGKEQLNLQSSSARDKLSNIQFEK